MMVRFLCIASVLCTSARVNDICYFLCVTETSACRLSGALACCWCCAFCFEQSTTTSTGLSSFHGTVRAARRRRRPRLSLAWQRVSATCRRKYIIRRIRSSMILCINLFSSCSIALFLFFLFWYLGGGVVKPQSKHCSSLC